MGYSIYNQSSGNIGSITVPRISYIKGNSYIFTGINAAVIIT
ncbi:MAG: hypothetical protein BWX46_00779 [Candidatus Cloacimonetes bacterium ADurb.Bin003]|nr:MAG: hypothetical protein BWX46_00779 [Candidatus Cloacimonetes bacterium ADurb.Bin003]